MLFELVCHNCHNIIREQVPLLSKEKGMDMICSHCDFKLMSYYDEQHPMAKMVQDLNKE